MIRRLATTHAVTRALIAIALLAIAFGHQPLRFGAPADAERVADLAAYALPDGSLPALCLGGGSSTHGKGHVFHAGCDACRLTASVAMPEPPCIGGGERVAIEAPARIANVLIAFNQTFPPSAPPTAPPLA
ncbi:MAG: hypothetical protein LJE67_05960 [Salaquimonas sp.]|nr:hypothetical protein [Salaquimonas sp.]